MWLNIMWTPAWDECGFCSSRLERYVAEYEAWYEVKGALLLHVRDGVEVREADDPFCQRIAMCEVCASEERAVPDDPDMPMVLIRTLK